MTDYNFASLYERYKQNLCVIKWIVISCVVFCPLFFNNMFIFVIVWDIALNICKSASYQI